MSDHEQEIAEGMETSAGVGAALARLSVNPANRIFKPEKGPEHILLRNANGGEDVYPLDKVGGVHTTPPGRIVCAVVVETEESLARYANRFKARNSVLFASISSSSVIAALDFHDREGEGGQTGEFVPAHVSHRAALHLPFSMEWRAWTEADGKLVPQLDFVRFLEENAEDIRTPAAATIMEACRDLQGLRKVDFRSVVREDSENYRIEYAESADARPKAEGVTLPAEFVLGLPVYFGGEEVEVRALLRHKLDDNNKLSLGIKLKRIERIRQAEFRRIVTSLSEATGIEHVYGSLAS